MARHDRVGCIPWIALSRLGRAESREIALPAEQAEGSYTNVKAEHAIPVDRSYDGLEEVYMTQVQQLATFVGKANYHMLSPQAVAQLKIRVLDSLACAIGALDGPPVRAIAEMIDEFGGKPLSTLIGGGKTAPDRAALYNGALVRYLDFNDSFLAPGETCHPSDNVAPVLAAAEYAGASSKQFLTALAVAYQVQTRLSEVAPVRDKGFDHTVQGSYAAAAGVAKALGLDDARTANAIAIAGTALNALRVTRTGALSNWKGLAYPHTAFGATHAAFLAAHGITGPAEVFEGNKGFMDSISGPFEIDWSKEDLEMVTRTIIKKYNAEIHSQAAIEGALELKEKHGFTADQVERIDIDIFDVAFNIIGGGEEGDKTIVRNKEEADHSLQYMVAVALLDDQVLPPQYAPERIVADDVQQLLHRVKVRATDEMSKRFPAEHACKVTIHLTDGRHFVVDKHDYEGFTTNPMSWDTVRNKFDYLSAPHAGQELRDAIAAASFDLENVPLPDLMKLLARVGTITNRNERPAEPAAAR